MPSPAIPLVREIERQIQSRTDRRVRNLAVEFRSDRVVVRGQTTSYHVKQLALHGLLDVLPRYWRIEDAITVS